MRKWTVLVALGFAAASAYGVGVGAGGFYALSMPMGDVADNFDMCMMGFGGKVMIGVMPYLNVDVGFGYHMKYKQKFDTEMENADDYYLTTIPITFGVSYPMAFDSMGVYFGGGGAFVMETFNAPEAATDTFEDVSKPGFYVGGGFKYYFTEKLAVDVNPRWMMVLDAVDDDPATEGDESTSSSMFIDFLLGVDYYFM